MSQRVKIIFGGVWGIYAFINPIVKNKINFMHLLFLLIITSMKRIHDTVSMMSGCCEPVSEVSHVMWIISGCSLLSQDQITTLA